MSRSVHLSSSDGFIDDRPARLLAGGGAANKSLIASSTWGWQVKREIKAFAVVPRIFSYKELKVKH